MDPVNHPPHYRTGVYEHVKVAEAWGLFSNAMLYNVSKYICRAGLKTENALEDLQKARWYLDREIQRLKKVSK